jgi:hypothetical protein
LTRYLAEVIHCPMIIISNLIGVAILLLPILFSVIGLLALRRFGWEVADWVIFLIWGLIVVVADLSYRFHDNDRWFNPKRVRVADSWAHPREGGHLFWIPCWVWGVVGILFTLYKLSTS